MKAKSTKNQRPVSVVAAVATAILLLASLVVFVGSAVAQTSLTISRASWDREDSELKARGTGPARTTVTIANAVTGVQLGSVTSAGDGQWEIERRLSMAPCSIRAVAAGQAAIRTVYGAPSTCGEGQPPAVSITGISISGPASINESSGAQYTCTATYSDHTTANVTANASWSDNSSVASVNGGYLAAGSVTGDRTVVLTANYSGRSASYTVTVRNQVTTAKSLSSLAVSGPSSVNEGASATYSATAAYSDGTSAPVTPTWSENSAYATIASNGLLTASTVTVNQTVAVTASYTEAGVNRSGSTNVTILNVAAQGTGSHAGRFSVYEGTATCIACHRTQANEVHASVHYQWKGDASEASGLNPGDAGKLGGINDFCIYPDINWIGKLTSTAGVQVDGGCAKCHAGLGAKPEPLPTQAQLENIDCLICHSQDYKRKVDLVNGVFAYVPDTQNMAVSILEAATDITLPNKDTCLNCHTKAGGGDNFKRGDIEEAHRNPTRSFDVHMSSAALGGAGLECLDCHAVQNHKIAGRGSDLRERELPNPVACTNCHTETPHGSQDIDKHTARVNCTVCHIPAFAKVAATDMERDWSRPGVPVPATGLFEPFHVKATNVVPEYRFFNGTSYFYQFGNPAVAETNGRIVLSEPEGSISDPGAKIHAFKHHLGNQPIDPLTRQLLPLKIGKFFETGQIAAAVELGAAGVGWAYHGYEFAQTERYMGLFHEVAPKESALTCNSCHNGGTRLDFAALGYTPNATRNGRPLCSSCHSSESGTFSSIHSRHVGSEGYDCNQCHTFSGAR